MLHGVNLIFSGKRKKPEPGKPYDYEVEWLQGDGTAYVDTGINFAGRNDTTIKFDCNVDFAVGEGDLSSSTTPVFLFGRSSTYRYGVYFNATSGIPTARARIGASTGANLPVEYERFCTASFQVNYGNNVCSIEDNVTSKSVTNTTNLSDANGAVNLFCVSQSSPIYGKTKIKRFDMNAYELGSINLIPVVKDGIGYFYDKISGKLFGNSAESGALIIGPKKELPYDYEVEWLQSDGISYVDTGIELYSPTNDLSRVEFDMTAELCIDPSKLSSSTVPRYISLVGIANDRNYGIGCSNQGDSFCATVYGNYNRYSTGYVVSADSTTLHELRLKIEAGICDFYYDGTLVKNASVPSSSYDLVPGIPFLVFARSYPSGGSIARIVNGMNRARRFKITSNGKTFDSIAVSKDGVGYFYNRASGQLIGNSAKDSNGNPIGALIMGPRVG